MNLDKKIYRAIKYTNINFKEFSIKTELYNLEIQIKLNNDTILMCKINETYSLLEMWHLKVLFGKEKIARVSINCSDSYIIQLPHDKYEYKPHWDYFIKLCQM